MTKEEKIIAGIILGAIAGIGAVVFFETERGKKLLAELKELASETLDDALERLVRIEKKFNEAMSEYDTESNED